MQLRLRAGASPFSLAWLLLQGFCLHGLRAVVLNCPPDDQLQASNVSPNLLRYA